MTAATPAQPAPVSPHLGCAVCASGVTSPHGAAGTPGQAALPPKWTGKFRKLPIVIEAVQLTSENIVDVMRWVAPAAKIGQAVDVTIDIDKGLTVATLEGDMTASFGDWVIKGVKGEFYPCKPDIFAATYEPAAQEPHAAPGLAIDLDADVTEEQAAEIRKALEAVNVTRAAVAPELAAAMRESRLRAEVITEILAAFGPSGSGHTARVGQVQIAKWRTRAGLTS